MPASCLPRNSAVVPCGLLLLICFISAGCGGEDTPPISTVTGRVTFGGEPVGEGSISFLSEDGKGGNAELQEDGTFSLTSQYGEGIQAGSYKVMISPPPDEAFVAIDDPNPPAPKEYPQIPEKYRSYATSGFTAEVGDDSRSFDFDMLPQ